MASPITLAILLGLVQGMTEVFPISSDGHLALVQMLFGGQGLSSTVLLHLGTLGATLLVLRKRAAAAFAEGVRGILRPSLLADTPGGRDAVVVGLATIPTAILGLVLREPARAWAASPAVVGACFLLSALAIGSTHWAPVGERDTPTRWGAVIVGVAQGASVLPGLSRSATTLAVLLWLGVRGERAFELSFLMAVPVILGAELFGAHSFEGGEGAFAVVLATLASFVAGLVALRLLRGVLARRLVAVFAIYLVPLSVATLAWGYARP
jgi:undecaprenyl-diphosphatase